MGLAPENGPEKNAKPNVPSEPSSTTPISRPDVPVHRAVPVEFEEKPLEPGIARIEFKETTIDIGRVSDTGNYQARFHFMNRGAEMLTLRKVTTGCKCAQAATARLSYGPGEQGSILVTLQPTGKEGYVPSVVRVLSNSSPNEMETLSMMAAVEPMLMLETGTLDVGRLAPGQEHSVSFELTTGITDLTFLKLETNRDYLKLRIRGKSGPDDEGYITYEGRLVVAADAPWSVFRGLRAAGAKFHARGTPFGETRPARARYSLRIEGSVYEEVVPTVLTGHGAGREGALIYLGNLPSNSAFEGRIELAGRSRPFRILETRIEAPAGLQAEVSTIERGERGHELILRGRAPARRGTLKGDVVVTTDVPGEELLRIGFQGSILRAR